MKKNTTFECKECKKIKTACTFTSVNFGYYPMWCPQTGKRVLWKESEVQND